MKTQITLMLEQIITKKKYKNNNTNEIADLYYINLIKMCLPQIPFISIIDNIEKQKFTKKRSEKFPYDKPKHASITYSTPHLRGDCAPSILE